MKLWIRLDAGTPRDPKITELARSLGVRRAEAFGLAASVWCVMAEHAVDGSLASIADADIEAWEYWQGKRGRFAAAFRAAFVDDDGNVGGWSERQGALLERMERDRKRHRKTPGDSPEPPRNNGGNSAEPPRSLLGDSTSTERNGTVRKEKSVSARPRSTPKALPEKPPAIPASVYDFLQHAWTMQAGAVDVGRFRKTVRLLLASGIRAGQIERAIRPYVEDRRERNQPVKLEWWAEEIQTWIRAADGLALEVMNPADFGLTDEQAAAKIAAHKSALEASDAELMRRITLEVVA